MKFKFYLLAEPSPVITGKPWIGISFLSGMFTGLERAGRVKISTSEASISARLFEKAKLFM